jgi:hypothetical protein
MVPLQSQLRPIIAVTYFNLLLLCLTLTYTRRAADARTLLLAPYTAVYCYRLTEAMAGIEIWSGCGLVLGPPIGGTIYPSFGVPGVFLTLSIFPAVMLLTVPGLRYSVNHSNIVAEQLCLALCGKALLW